MTTSTRARKRGADTEATNWLREREITFADDAFEDDAQRRFVEAWTQIHDIYPDEGDESRRTAALEAAVEYLRHQLDPWEAGDRLAEARGRAKDATAAARQVAVMAFEDGATQTQLAADLRVNRARTLRPWLAGESPR